MLCAERNGPQSECFSLLLQLSLHFNPEVFSSSFLRLGIVWHQENDDKIVFSTYLKVFLYLNTKGMKENCTISTILQKYIYVKIKARFLPFFFAFVGIDNISRQLAYHSSLLVYLLPRV
jgi:hypothetical protein